jgi:CNT family concentrative nucleoside transporter
LISASILSAPAALVISKIILPESEVPKTLGVQIIPYYQKESTLFEAIINGSNNGVKLIVGIAALLIAVLGLVSLIDLVVGGIGGKVNVFTGMHIDWSLQGLLGYLFYPFTIVIGVPISDAYNISKIIGERVVVTEVVSYQDLANLMEQGLLIHPRSVIVATYALCGFAHLASLAIFVGGISALAPDKKGVIAGVGFRALIAATLACMMTACVAGMFIYGDSVLMVR